MVVGEKFAWAHIPKTGGIARTCCFVKLMMATFFVQMNTTWSIWMSMSMNHLEEPEANSLN
jgi:hypothetical protein